MKPLALSLAAAVTLAACSGDAREPSARADSTATGARALAPTGAESQGDEYWTELPDFGNLAEFLDTDSFRVEEWETPVQGDRDARLKALGIEPVRVDRDDPAYSEEYAGQRAEWFHFVDFSGDGVADVIYDGQPYYRNDDGDIGSLDGWQLILWQVMGGRAVKVLDEHTRLQRVWRGRPGEPLRFRTVQFGCCDDRHILVEYHRPEMRGDTVRYRVAHRVMGSSDNQAPRTFLPRAKPFTVTQDRYRLRHEPSVSEEIAEGGRNFAAEYAAARGASPSPNRATPPAACGGTC